MKKTFKDLCNRILGAKKKPAAAEPVPANPAAPVAGKVRRPDYKDLRYLELAKQCAMGDIVAMMDMARWHRGQLEPEFEVKVAKYEENPCVDTQQLIFPEIRYNDPLKYYITWVHRAAMYGNDEARSIAERCTFYKYYTLLKEKTLQVDRFGCEHYYSSDLRSLGFRQISSELDEFHLYSLRRDGIFPAYYLADYIPADSDGFGREDEYADIYFDEFFNLLPGDTLAQAQEALPKVLARREKYWADPRHDREHRMYRRLLSQPEK